MSGGSSAAQPKAATGRDAYSAGVAPEQRPPIRSGDLAMTASAGRTALFPIAPTAPLMFAAGSAERASVATALKEVRQADYDVASLIGGEEVRTGRRVPIVTPHEHAHQLGHVHYA